MSKRQNKACYYSLLSILIFLSFISYKFIFNEIDHQLNVKIILRNHDNHIKDKLKQIINYNMINSTLNFKLKKNQLQKNQYT